MEQQYICDRLTDSLDAIASEVQELNRNLWEIAASLDAIKNRMDALNDK